MCGHSNMHFPLWVHFRCNFEMRLGRTSRRDDGIWPGHCGAILTSTSYIVSFSNSCHTLLWRTYIWCLNKANSHLGGYFKDLLSFLGHLGLSKNQNHCCRCCHLLSGRKYIQALAQAQTPKTRGFTLFNTWA